VRERVIKSSAFAQLSLHGHNAFQIMCVVWREKGESSSSVPFCVLLCVHHSPRTKKGVKSLSLECRV